MFICTFSGKILRHCQCLFGEHLSHSAHKKHTSSQQSWRTKSKARQRNETKSTVCVCVFVCNKQHNTKWSDRITINELQWCNKSARQSFLCCDGFVQANVRNCCTLFLNFKSALCKLICRSFLWVRVFCVHFIFGIAVNRFSIPLQSSQFRILHVARVILEHIMYSRFFFFLLERNVPFVECFHIQITSVRQIFLDNRKTNPEFQSTDCKQIIYSFS